MIKVNTVFSSILMTYNKSQKIELIWKNVENTTSEENIVSEYHYNILGCYGHVILCDYPAGSNSRS